MPSQGSKTYSALSHPALSSEKVSLYPERIASLCSRSIPILWQSFESALETKRSSTCRKLRFFAHYATGTGTILFYV